MGSRTNVAIDRVYKHGTDILLKEHDSICEINNFFARVGERVNQELIDIPYVQKDAVDDQMNDLKMFKKMTLKNFLELVESLSCSKSSGIDVINSKLMIAAMMAIPTVFLHFCNTSLLT